MVHGRSGQKSAPSVSCFAVAGDMDLNSKLFVRNPGTDRVEQHSGGSIAFGKAVAPYFNRFGLTQSGIGLSPYVEYHRHIEFL